MKGSTTAEVIRLVAMACCVRLVGSEARAENWRIIEWDKFDRMAIARAILGERRRWNVQATRGLGDFRTLDSAHKGVWVT